MVAIEPRRRDTAPMLLAGAAVLTAAIAALGDYPHGAAEATLWLAVSLWLLWRVSRGGRLSWVLSTLTAALGAVLFSAATVEGGASVHGRWLAVLYGALAATLLTAPVREHAHGRLGH